MGRLILRRLLSVVPLLFIVSVLVFGLILLLPGDPARTIAGEEATPAQVAQVREQLGLDEPLVAQYGRWVAGVLHGDLGTSLFVNYDVDEAISSRASVTASLVGLALIVSLGLGVPLGALAGSRPGSRFDRIVTMGASAGVAIPNFWLGLVLVLFFAMGLEWFPATGYVGPTTNMGEWCRCIALPVVTLAVAGVAEVLRQTRASMTDQLRQDYVRTLRAKGLRPSQVRRHALKNAMVPVVTVAGLLVSRLFGLSVIVEQVFGLPGVGSLAVEAVFKRDIPMIQGIVLCATVVVLVTNLLVDLSYRYFNPKVTAA